MSEQKQGVAGKLENVFLEILRFVILAVLAVSLIGAIVMAFNGSKDLGATESTYQPEKIDNKALIEELKKLLEDKPDIGQEAPAKKESKANVTANNPLDQELDKQVKAINAFLGNFDKSLTNPERFKDGLRQKANKLAWEPSSEASVMEYAKGQTEIFQLAFADQSMVETLQRRGDDALLNKFFSLGMDIYPQFFESQHAKRKEFEAQELIRVAQVQASAMNKIYIAGGMFGAFLLISLLLVLVKIERNLRVRPI